MNYSQVLDTFFLNEGYVHLVFNTSDITSIIHHYSFQKYGIVSDSFIAYIEKISDLIPKKINIVLEITGQDYSKEEQENIQKVIRNHFLFQNKKIQEAKKSSLLRIVWFILLSIIFSTLLFMVKDETNSLLVQLAYLPFWFFGYRILIYGLIDHKELIQESEKILDFLNMSYIFSGKVSLDQQEKGLEEFMFQKENRKVDTNDLIENYFLDQDIYRIGCKVNSVEEVVEESCIEGYEFIADEFDSYIEKLSSFCSLDYPLLIDIAGEDFSQQEKKTIEDAIWNSYHLKLAKAQKEVSNNQLKIILFAICLIGISIVYAYTTGFTNIAVNEFIVMMFWFFGDYLLEFVLIGYKSVVEEKRRVAQLASAKVIFQKKLDDTPLSEKVINDIKKDVIKNTKESEM